MTTHPTRARAPRRVTAGLALAALTFGMGRPVEAQPVQVPPVDVQAIATLSSMTGSVPQSRDGLNRQVRIHNQTGWTMLGLQAASAGSRDWSGDILDAPALPAGASGLVDIDDGRGACVYDLRARFANGQSLDRPRVNVCQIGDFYYTR